MINKLLLSFSLLLLLSCANIELVLSEKNLTNQFKGKTFIVFDGTEEEKFARELFSFFGNNKEGEFILITSFSETKENRLVKQNQVAEKIDYIAYD